MKDLKAIRGKFFLARAIAEGEHERQDFKFAISDARKIARSLSAFANHSGGRLLIGVKDNGVIAGVRNEEDIYVIEQAASRYCRPQQHLEFTAFSAADGLTVIRAEIGPSPSRPVYACDTDGGWKAYYRVADENILAPDLMVRAWKHRASGQPSTLALGPSEQTLLAILRRDSLILPEAFVTEARVSLRTANDVIVRLYGMGVIDFTFSDRRFHICLPPDDQP